MPTSRIAMLLNLDVEFVPAICSALGIALVFVMSMYIWPQTFDRNHPTCVKQRMFSAVLVTLLSPLLLPLLGSPSPYPDHHVLSWIGVRDPLSALLPLSLTLILFLGPLFQHYSMGEGILSDYDSYSDILLLRNLVIAPVTEEIVFRGCLSAVLFHSLGWQGTIFFQPMFFGVAHLHHGFQRLMKGEPLANILATILLQTAFTSLFGAYSTLVFLTTGSVFGPIVCHAFCNYMGFPSFDTISDSPRPWVTSILYCVGLGSFIWLCPSVLNCDRYRDSLYCNL